jgi:hypothetical protein
VSTSWETEHYTTAAFGNLKRGVGLVLDAGAPVRLGTIVVRTGTPGFKAMVKAGDSPAGPFVKDASSTRTVDGRTTFDLHLTATHRYYVIWITTLTQIPDGGAQTPYGAQIAEVSGT